MFIPDQDQMLLLTADELASIRDKINKEIERRNGGDIDIKKVRAQLLRVAISLGCDWIDESYRQPTTEDTDKPKRRGRKPKTDQTAETEVASQTKPQQATPQVDNAPIDEENRRPLWRL